MVAIDQIISNAAKNVSNEWWTVNVPMFSDGPTVSAGQLGATHQAFESWYANRPILKIVPSNPYDAKGLLKFAIRDNDPSVIFMESEQIRRQNGKFQKKNITSQLVKLISKRR